jgi:peptidoglycan/xylan/chitin deacetylase (PgdA/CDA1 family)
MTAFLNVRKTNGPASRAMMALSGRAIWRTPGCFTIARVFGSAYSLRCVVFHDISAAESPFTNAMGVSISPGEFEAALKFLVRCYTPVSLDHVLAGAAGGKLPQRAVLVTFDDAYASAVYAAEICGKLRVPAVFFLNAAFLDNTCLAPDNLVCYVANVFGLDVVKRGALAVKGSDSPPIRSMADVFHGLFPLLSPVERQAFLNTVAQLAGISETALAREASLYLTSRQVRELASAGFEIGSHTFSHIHCRSLAAQGFTSEIGRNEEKLSMITGKKVRSFSVPYGSSADLNGELIRYLKRSGYQAAFLSESVANAPNADPLHFDRVSIRTGAADALFSEVEILPRLRVIRNRLSRRRTSAPKPARAPFALTQGEHSNESFERTQDDSE